MPLLEIKNLKTHFFTDRGVVKAVDGVTLSLDRGEAVGIVGESGCGKSVTALSILRLIPNPPGKIVGGEVWLTSNGHRDNLVTMSEREIRGVRGQRVAMVFQEPMTALNPVFTIGNQIEEAVLAHKKMGRAEAKARVVELLGMVGISEPASRYKNYPHELSGGMRQRVVIAMALAGNPEILIADEPTTALDVTIQAQVLELLTGLKERLGMALLLITHDMGVVAETVKRVAVMYCGRIVETAPVAEIFDNPLHPYTQGLLKAIPPLKKVAQGVRLPTIPGRVPDLVGLKNECLFRERCYKAENDCAMSEPELLEVKPGHWVRCYHW